MLSKFEQIPYLSGGKKNHHLTVDLLAKYTHILCLLQGTTRITSSLGFLDLMPPEGECANALHRSENSSARPFQLSGLANDRAQFSIMYGERHLPPTQPVVPHEMRSREGVKVLNTQQEGM